MPERVAKAVGELGYWFVIGGHAVRCFCPYRPSEDVDFGVEHPKGLQELVRALGRRGKFEVIEREPDTIHGRFDGIDVSVFVLRELAPFTEEQALTLPALLATKLHAILDRGTRRDFFDLYVLLEQHQLGLVECLRALREVYRGADINEGLILRALSYFDDAEREAPLPGEARGDLAVVKAFFQSSVGALIVPPPRRLGIASHVVGVRAKAPKGRGKPKRARKKAVKR